MVSNRTAESKLIYGRNAIAMSIALLSWAKR